MVVLTHYAAFLPAAPAGFGYLWTGVDFFFVISGYVFAPMLLVSHNARPRPAPRYALLPFWLRRFFRIYPLYLLALCAYAVAMPADAMKDVYFLRHLAFLHTTSSFEEAYYFNPAFWSLPVEMEFYLMLPLLALLRARPRALAAVFAATLALSLCANYLRGPGVDMWRLLSVHLPTILPEFLLGTLLAWAVAQGKQAEWHWRSPPALLAFGGGVALVIFTYLVKYGGLGWEQYRVLDAPWNFLCAAAYALLMYPLLLTHEIRWPAWLRQTALFAGASSYGVYLFHNLMPRLLSQFGMEAEGVGFVLLAFLLTVALALLLYRYYENPLRRYGRDLAHRVTQQQAVKPA